MSRSVTIVWNVEGFTQPSPVTAFKGETLTIINKFQNDDGTAYSLASVTASTMRLSCRTSVTAGSDYFENTGSPDSPALDGLWTTTVTAAQLGTAGTYVLEVGYTETGPKVCIAGQCQLVIKESLV